MYEEITRYANSISTLDENEAVIVAKELGDVLVSSSLLDERHYETLANRGVGDPWLADAEHMDASGIIAILSKIREADFWCDGGWRSAVRSGYLSRLLGRLSELDAGASQAANRSAETA